MLKLVTKNKWMLLSFSVLYAFIFLLTFYPYANDGPRGIHQWAQSDRLALALRYIDGNELTDAATLSLKTDDGRTGVEFSGYQYAIAQLVRVGVLPKAYLPFFYRISTFTLLFTSFFILVFSLLKKEKIIFKSLILLGLLSSPILLYYSYNFLPDVLGLSLLLFCLYLFNKDFEKYLYLILIVSGLSLLIKTSSGIYFISFMAIYFLRHWNLKNIKHLGITIAAVLLAALTFLLYKNEVLVPWALFIAIACGIVYLATLITVNHKKFTFSTLIFILIGSFVAYYDIVHVSQRNTLYYSFVFLSNTMEVKSLAEFFQIFDTASRFKSQYFNGAQRLVIGVLFLIAMYRRKSISLRNKNTQLALLVGTGLLTILLLFGVQFMNHDYYVIATFLPITLYFTLKGTAYICEYIHPRTSMVLASIFALVSFSQGNNAYFNRMSEVVWINNYAEYYERNWLIGAQEKVDKILPAEASIMSVYSQEPNFVLVYLDRKGLTINLEEMQRAESPFTLYLNRLNMDYVICYSRFTDWFKRDQPIFISKAEVLYSDDKFTLYKSNGY